MWHHKYLTRLDLKLIFVIFLLMGISLLVISSMTLDIKDNVSTSYLTSTVKSQMQWFLIGWGVFLFFSGFNYHKFRNLSWFLYFFMIMLLLGLYFSNPIQSVHRWYKIPFINMNIQPSEYTKLIIVICLAWFLEKKKR